MNKKISCHLVNFRGQKITTLFLLLFMAFICNAQQIPSRPTPPRLVNDYTNTLNSSQEHYLEQMLRNYNDTTSTQIAVVFVNDLQGTTAADFAYQLGEKWGVGTKENNGIVILVKPKNETKGEVFISVGYGLEQYIPDAMAKRIIENQMIPNFKNNDYFTGVNNAVDSIIKLASGDSAMIKEEVTAEDIADVVSRWTGIPVSKMMQSEREKLLFLEDELHKRVIGQDEAIQAVADAVRRSRAGLQDPKRPIGSFIFLGTTGVGKTELAKALAEYLFDDESLMTRIDMSEYQEKHTVSRLIGAPPGYVGYDEGGQLTEAVRRKPYSVVLFDEIEKAHPDVFNVLLQVLDDGRLTDNKGRTVNFKNTIIIMTSNLGSAYIQSQFEKMNDDNHELLVEETKNEVMNMLKKTIRPEFLNRIDETIMFLPLNKTEIEQIVRLQIKGIQRMLEDNGVNLHLSDMAIDFLATAGYDPEFGARPVKRAIQRYLLNDLSKKLLSMAVDRSKPIIVERDSEGLKFRN